MDVPQLPEPPKTKSRFWWWGINEKITDPEAQRVIDNIFGVNNAAVPWIPPK